MSLTLLPLGTGDAFSALHHSCSSALLYDGAVLLIDCPHPLRKVMHDAQQKSGLSVDVSDVTACVVTHLHADHASGLEGFLWFQRFALGRKGKLVMHAEVQQHLWQGHLFAGMHQLLMDDGTFHQLGLTDVADIVVASEQAITHIGPFAIELHRTIHHIPTFALRVTAGDTCVSFSADTAFDAALFAWLAQADLMVHEAGFGPAHTPYETLAALPAELRARMRLTHLSDTFDMDASAIACLREGEPITVVPRQRA